MTTRPLVLLALLLAACGGQVSETGAGGTDDLRGAAAGAVQGVDVSHYQGDIDWGAVKGSGRSFAIAAIGDGEGFIDWTFGGHWRAMKEAGLIRGSYQFFRAAESADAQADIVVRAVGRLGAEELVRSRARHRG
jgi:lysozyme